MTSTYVAELIDAGADAMTNMFEVEFHLGGSTYANALRIRVKGFTPPEPKQASYDVYWKTVSVKQKATKIELERKLNFTFRVDAYYQVYAALKAYQNNNCNASKGYAANANNAAIRGSYITVRAVDTPVTNISDTAAESGNSSSSEVRGTSMEWKFWHPWIEELKLSEYSPEDAKPQEAIVSLYYDDYSEPFN